MMLAAGWTPKQFEKRIEGFTQMDVLLAVNPDLPFQEPKPKLKGFASVTGELNTIQGTPIE